ncbi:hypothetical protein BKA56DRAFT_614508 [Ilyonectria sp. MPI-CAGE-AT-0026]|nr:hypothetical protein BKA56DRAFT_614508 [Ilyonectria sp. MPI-CAGE-AT-0026]
MSRLSPPHSMCAGTYSFVHVGEVVWLALAPNSVPRKYRCLLHSLVSQPLDQAFHNIESHVTSCRLDLAQPRSPPPWEAFSRPRTQHWPISRVGYRQYSQAHHTEHSSRGQDGSKSFRGLRTVKDSASELSSHMAHASSCRDACGKSPASKAKENAACSQMGDVALRSPRPSQLTDSRFSRPSCSVRMVEMPRLRGTDGHNGNGEAQAWTGSLARMPFREEPNHGVPGYRTARLRPDCGCDGTPGKPYSTSRVQRSQTSCSMQASAPARLWIQYSSVSFGATVLVFYFFLLFLLALPPSTFLEKLKAWCLSRIPAYESGTCLSAWAIVEHPLTWNPPDSGREPTERYPADLTRFERIGFLEKQLDPPAWF